MNSRPENPKTQDTVKSTVADGWKSVRQRAARADKAAYRKILENVPSRPPIEGDELP